MAREQDKDDSVARIVNDYFGIYLQLALVIVLPYVVVGALMVSIVASVYPEAAAVVAIILVLVLGALFLTFLRLRRRLLHFLIARRADKQNAAYLKGKDKGVHGKFRPEDLGGQ